MKKTLICCLFLAALYPSVAQSVFRPGTQLNPPGFDEAIQSVYLDFATNFRNIQGELITDEAEYEKYASIVVLPGAMETVITRFHSVQDTTASWQSTMLITEEYEDAARLYQKMCQQMKRAKVTLVDGSVIQFRPDYQAPSPDRKFSSSFYSLPASDPKFRYVRVEVELIALLAEYRVLVNVHQKFEDDLGEEW